MRAVNGYPSAFYCTLNTHIVSYRIVMRNKRTKNLVRQLHCLKSSFKLVNILRRYVRKKGFFYFRSQCMLRQVDLLTHHWNSDAGVVWSCCCVECVAGRSEATINHVDSDAEIPSDTVQQTIRKLELVRRREVIIMIATCVGSYFMMLLCIADS